MLSRELGRVGVIAYSFSRTFNTTFYLKEGDPTAKRPAGALVLRDSPGPQGPGDASGLGNLESPSVD